VADPLEEFLAIVQRDLAASFVRVGDAAEAAPEGEASLRQELPDGRLLTAVFPALPHDLEARRRRLEMLISAFADVLAPGQDERRGRTPRPPPARSLAEELAALAQRSGALEVAVIDAFSPVVWGSAGPLDQASAPPVPAAPGASSPDEIAALAHQTAHYPWSVGLHSVGADDVSAAELGITSARGMRVDPEAVRLIPYAVCARYRLMPMGKSEGRLLVAMVDPRDVDAIHDVVLVTGLPVQPVLADESLPRFLHHLDEADAEGHAPPSYDEVMAAIAPEERAAREPLAQRARDAWHRVVLAHRALALVRELPEIELLHKGGQLRHAEQGEGFGYLARSFSAIYVVVLVFDGPFDEFLVKRALTHAMPTIERLVEALPPLDPPPRMGSAAAVRPPKRRR
jgi:hypothetical protein